MAQEAISRWRGNSGLESLSNCDSNMSLLRRSALLRVTRLKMFNSTVTKFNGNVVFGYPTDTRRYLEVEHELGWPLVGVGGGTSDR